MVNNFLSYANSLKFQLWESSFWGSQQKESEGGKMKEQSLSEHMPRDLLQLFSNLQFLTFHRICFNLCIQSFQNRSF